MENVLPCNSWQATGVQLGILNISTVTIARNSKLGCLKWAIRESIWLSNFQERLQYVSITTINFDSFIED